MSRKTVKRIWITRATFVNADERKSVQKKQRALIDISVTTHEGTDTTLKELTELRKRFEEDHVASVEFLKMTGVVVLSHSTSMMTEYSTERALAAVKQMVKTFDLCLMDDTKITSILKELE